VALFGPPGAGKSTVAKAIAKRLNPKIINLSVLEDSSLLYSTLHRSTDAKSIFLDEFDVELRGGYWYRWLLTPLWDGEVAIRNANNVLATEKLPKPLVIFLAASRYETHASFRDFALTAEGKTHKAADLLSRIDVALDLLRLSAEDRAVLINAMSKGNADQELLALCYLAELEDHGRGIAKLLKGVDTTNWGAFAVGEKTLI
jgi:energy-coupling factor transporter ATP-binding protein EcfA2